MTGASLSVEGLVFAHPGRTLFAGWSHRFQPGLTWVRGPNGCGKSTLLRLLGGAIEPQAGQLRIANIEARSEPLAYRREVQWCGPDGIAFEHLTPAEYIGFLAGLYPRFDMPSAVALSEALGLHVFWGQRIRQLSSGTQRKVGLVAAMAAGTAAVLLDEPLATLDRTALAVMHRHLAAAARQQDRVWVITSHEPLGEAEAQANVIDLA